MTVRGLRRRSALVGVGAVVCTSWCWWLLSIPWLLGATAWTVVIPWLVFACAWAVVVLPDRTVRLVLPLRVVPWVLVPAALFGVTVVSDLAHLPLVARVAVSQRALLRAVPVASGLNPPEQRAGLYTVQSAYREAGTGGTIINLTGGFLSTGSLEHLSRGVPNDEPDDEWSSTVHLYGPWWARSSNLP